MSTERLTQILSASFGANLVHLEVKLIPMQWYKQVAVLVRDIDGEFRRLAVRNVYTSSIQ